MGCALVAQLRHPFEEIEEVVDLVGLRQVAALLPGDIEDVAQVSVRSAVSAQDLGRSRDDRVETEGRIGRLEPSRKIARRDLPGE